jgi:hypothetical protein
MKKPKPTPPTIAAARSTGLPRNVSNSPIASSMNKPPQQVGDMEAVTTELGVVREPQLCADDEHRRDTSDDQRLVE